MVLNTKRDRIADRQHRSRAGARREAERARFFELPEFDDNGRSAATVLAFDAVIATSGTSKSLSDGSSCTTSPVSPLCVSISTTSVAWMRPRSP